MICPSEVSGYLARAQRALEVAQALLDDGYAPEAVSRAYYAMFYAAQALLKSEDIHVSKHSAVVAKFGECFSKTGRLDPKFHRMLIRTRKAREIADYRLADLPTDESAAEKLAQAKAFVAAAEREVRQG